ncbi:hypothetical protein FACS1894158_15710 [Betaproteobacteria bacterium]|nr:hypothetical protein FACS1894158_15710 [Betaproteobacteria bacterium]
MLRYISQGDVLCYMNKLDFPAYGGHLLPRIGMEVVLERTAGRMTRQ